MIGNGPPAGERAPCAVRLFTKQTALQNREPQDNAPGKKTRGLAARGERAGCTEFPLLHIEPEQDHIAVRHNIFLAFGAHGAGIPGRRFRAVPD